MKRLARLALTAILLMGIACPVYAKDVSNPPVEILLDQLSSASSTPNWVHDSTGPGWVYTASSKKLLLTDETRQYVLKGANKSLLIQVTQPASVVLDGVTLQAPEGEDHTALWFMNGGTLTAKGENRIQGGDGSTYGNSGNGIASNGNTSLDLTVQGSLSVSAGAPTGMTGAGDAVAAHYASVHVLEGGRLTLQGGSSQGNGGNGLGVYVGSLVIKNDGTISATGGKGDVPGNGITVHESLAVSGSGTLTATGKNGIEIYGKYLQLDGGDITATGTIFNGVCMPGSRDAHNRLYGSGNLTAKGGTLINGAAGISWVGTLELGIQGDLTAVGGTGPSTGGSGMSGGSLIITAAPSSLTVVPTQNLPAIAVYTDIENRTGVTLPTDTRQGPIDWTAPAEVRVSLPTQKPQGVYWIGVGEANLMLHAAGDQQKSYAKSNKNGATGIRAEALETLGATKLLHNTSDGTSLVRVTISEPQRAKEDLLLSGYIRGEQVNALQNTLRIRYANKAAVICMDQQTAWGLPVQISANLNLSGFDTKNLVLYSHNRASGKIERITKPDYTIDGNGYLTFTTNQGGDIIVSSGALTAISK